MDVKCFIFFRLQYVEAVLAEVMRINTVAAVAPAHRVTQDTTLNGYSIPKVGFFTAMSVIISRHVDETS